MLAQIGLQILIMLLMILANGLFAMAEIAVLSARRTQLTRRAREGDAGAQAALDLLAQPNRFLSAIQVGITLVGVLAGAFGGATIAQEIAIGLSGIAWLAPYAETLGVAVVVLATTYLTLVLGELAPKRIALSDAEGIAARLARPMTWLARVMKPVVHVLSASTEFVVRLTGQPARREQAVSEEEIRILVEQGAQMGTLEVPEGEIVDRVLRLDDLLINQIMTPHTAIEWLDIGDGLAKNMAFMARSRHKSFPVARGSLNEVLGIVSVKRMWDQHIREQRTDLNAAMREVLFVPENVAALTVLETFREAGTDIALVINEFGSVEGLVTLNDILEAMVGDIPLPGEQPTPRAERRTDGSWLVDGRMGVSAFETTFNLHGLALEPRKNFQTVGGYVMSQLDRIPEEGDVVVVGQWALEVIDMDGRRVDKVLIQEQQSKKGRAEKK